MIVSFSTLGIDVPSIVFIVLHSFVGSVVVVVCLRSWVVSVYASLLEIAEFPDRFHWFAPQV